MKTGNKDIKKSKKNPTTNYAPDKHKKFCSRCFEFNEGCPKNGKNYADRNCDL